MNYALVKQETYPAPIDGLFIIKISKAEFNSMLNKIDMDVTNNDYMKVIGNDTDMIIVRIEKPFTEFHILVCIFGF